MQVTKAGLARVKSDDFKRAIFAIMLELHDKAPHDEVYTALAFYTTTALVSNEKGVFAIAPEHEMVAEANEFIAANDALIRQTIGPIVCEIVQAGMALGKIPSN